MIPFFAYLALCLAIGAAFASSTTFDDDPPPVVAQHGPALAFVELTVVYSLGCALVVPMLLVEAVTDAVLALVDWGRR